MAPTWYEAQAPCPGSGQAAACSRAGLDFTKAGLTPNQEAQVVNASTTPGRLVLHGALDAQGRVGVDIVWIEYTAQ